MIYHRIDKGATSQSVTIRIVDSTDGTPETGVVFNTAGIDLKYRRDGAAAVAITEATLAALTTAWTDGGFIHIGDGYYRLDVPDLAFATGVDRVVVFGTVTGMVVIGAMVELTDPLTISNGGVLVDNFTTAAKALVETEVTDGLTTYGAATAAAATAIETDTQDIQSRLPAALTAGGNMKSDPLAINGDTTAAANLAKTTRAIGRGTASGVPTTTSIPTSAFTPASASAVIDQFKGRIITFDADTTTAALRGQSTDITANTAGATPTFTVTALTTAPAVGDTFSVT